MTWGQCRDSAVALGGYLASILSQEENDFVKQLLNTAPVQVLFCNIGGHERNGENDWQWVSGEPWGYFNWNTGEPNNLCSPPNPGCENIVQMYGHTDPVPPSGTWVDGDSLTPDQAGVGSFVVEYNCDCPHQGDIASRPTGDGVIDVFDVIEEIGIAFSGSPDIQDPNCPKTRGDVDNNGVADVFDVIYLIATAFSGGPIPVNPCVP